MATKYSLPVSGGPPSFAGMPGTPMAPGGPNRPETLTVPGVAIGGGPANNIPSLGLPFQNMTSGYEPSRQYGLEAFHTIPHHYVATCPDGDQFAAETTSQLGKGMLLFSRSFENQPRGKQPARLSGQAAVDSNTTQFMELTQLNRWLMENSDRYATPEEVMNEWRLLGVLKVDVAPGASDSNFGRRSPSRTLNVVVGHRVKTFNLWPHAEEGMALWLVLKRVRNGMRKRTRNAPATVWRFEPYADRARAYPPPSALEYESEEPDQHTKKHFQKLGARVYVGTVGDVGEGNHVSHNNSAGIDVYETTTNLFGRGLLPLVEVYLGV